VKLIKKLLEKVIPSSKEVAEEKIELRSRIANQSERADWIEYQLRAMVHRSNDEENDDAGN
jgi:hypothetical protein